MEYQQKLLLVVGILVIFAVYIMTTIQPPTAVSTSEAETLLLKSVQFGNGLGNYVYEYSEVSNGYQTTYKLTKSSNEKMVEIRNPLSVKKVYILANDTILCIRYPLNQSEVCSSIKEDTLMGNYINFVQALFFNDTNIQNAKSNLDYIIVNKYLKMNPVVVNDSVGGHACSRITYTIDYTNVSLADSTRFGIGPTTPKIFYATRCVDSQTGIPYETVLEYTSIQGMQQKTVTRIVELRTAGNVSIEAPTSLSSNAVQTFRNEREQYVKLATCHTDKSGAERESCVAGIALNLKRTDICELSGSRRDRCLVSIVPLTKEQSICPLVNDASFRDDCYVELAGTYKNSTYCSNVQNTSKIVFCQTVAMPRTTTNQTIQNETNPNITRNQTGTDNSTSRTSGNRTSVDIDRLLDLVDKSEQNRGNTTNTTVTNQSEFE